MTRRIALLRGINVGGRHKAPMADVRAVAASLTWKNVTTYLASGNVFLDAPPELTDADLAQAFSDALGRRFGFAIPCVVRRPEALRQVLRACPWPDVADPRFVHWVAGAGRFQRTQSFVDYAPDEVVLLERDAWVHYPNGSGRSRLTLDVLQRSLGKMGTGRNLRTARALLQRAAL